MMIVAVFTKMIDYFLSLPQIKYNIYISFYKILCIYLIYFFMRQCIKYDGVKL